MFKQVGFKSIFDILFFLVVVNTVAKLFIILSEGLNPSLTERLYQPKRILGDFFILGAINEFLYAVTFVLVAYQLRQLAKIFLVNREFKSLKVVKHLRYVGRFLIILGLCLVVKKAFLLYYFEVSRHYLQTNMVLYLLIIVLGLSLLRVSKMLKLSIKAKQELDLTI